MNYKLIEMPVHGDRRGKLVAVEALQDVPFEIKRVYYMFDTLPNESRGFHAHKNLEQIIIAMDGACRFVLDDGKNREGGRYIVVLLIFQLRMLPKAYFS